MEINTTQSLQPVNSQPKERSQKDDNSGECNKEKDFKSLLESAEKLNDNTN